MHHIEIIHNPFIVDTRFVINGEPPADGCKLSSYKESRLQLWIEKLFDELSMLFNGDSNFHVVFHGVESDYADVVEAASVASARGMQIDVTWQATEATENRLESMRSLMTEARAHPKFDAYIEEDEEMKKCFEEAFNADFDVYVVATMSSGKSTLINAMLGHDLLPAANEATTATITSIADDKGLAAFRGSRYDKQGREDVFHENVTLDTITDWNRRDDTMRIAIQGDIQAVKQRDNVRLVLTDTPGPNNSQDQDHERVTMSFVQDSRRNPLILYVLNATQLGTNDDKNLLRLVADAMRRGGKQSRDRFIFVINKMDVFDPEKGEDLPSVLTRVRKYLGDNGIQNPLVYPVSANLTRLIRKPGDRHSRKERGDYNTMADLFSEVPSMNLLQYMPITSRVTRALEARQHSPLMLSSGLPAVEAMIDEYIDKYNLPHRVKRVYDALSKAIDVGLNESQLMSQLEHDEKELAFIEDELQDLQARRAKGFNAAAYKDQIAREGSVLPPGTELALARLQADNDKFIKEVTEQLVGVTTPELAEQKMNETEENLRFHFNTLVNQYESEFEDSQQAIKLDLAAQYQRYVTDLFDECRKLDLPVLEGIRKSVAGISLNLGVEDNEIKTRRVVVGTREVSTSKWYKPWTWGDTGTSNIYGNEEYIDLADLWKERQTRVRGEFSKLVKSARMRIEVGKDKLIDQFLTFMTLEFDTKFDALLNSIDHKLTDKKAREAALAEARQLQEWITAFKAKLDQALAV
ncbi:dynamin family protein [Janthinobacterium sp. J1-1]|uniref:dynamin family protein n=1 Tax=unclassified Janthinobacterium TaxID=2610881 RepID=UPI002812826D|nr:dynamin family protein [Janthinobacterium sp. J1-1]